MSENKATSIQPGAPGPQASDTEEVARDHSEPTLRTPSISPADAEKLASKYQASWDQFTPTPEGMSMEPASTSDSGAWAQNNLAGRASDPATDGKIDPDQTGRVSAVPMSSAKRSPIVWGAAAAGAIVLLLLISLILRSQHSEDGSEENVLPQEPESTEALRPEPVLPTPQAATPSSPSPTAPSVEQPAAAPAAPAVVAAPPVVAAPAAPVAAAPAAPPASAVVSQPAPRPVAPAVVAAPTQPRATPVASPRAASPQAATPARATSTTAARRTAPAQVEPAATPAPRAPRRQRGGFIADNPYE
ncbi:MAG: hypothetical protein IPK60_20405 [Sandaracinaceae bacterium]|nr:hypothetical protein [Sandaracinaceae bacterium]